MQTVLYDLDGTLIDSALDIVNACNQVAVANGYTPLPVTNLRPLVGHGSRGIMARIARLPEMSDRVMQLRDQVLARYASCGYPNTRLFPELRPMLKAINASSLQWGIVTSKPKLHSQQIVDRDPELQGCALLLGHDDVVAIKPSPSGLVLAAAKLAVQVTDCIYVGDNRVDILAARRAGMRSIGVGYGYCSEVDHPLNFDPDFYAESPLDLCQLVTSLLHQQLT